MVAQLSVVNRAASKISVVKAKASFSVAKIVCARVGVVAILLLKDARVIYAARLVALVRWVVRALVAHALLAAAR